jgi:hypothetical protein
MRSILTKVIAASFAAWLVGSNMCLAQAESKPAARNSNELTYSDLVNRMIDLERLAVLPLPGERGAMWSSYDRKSRFDAATGKCEKWDANSDGGGFIRTEGTNQVMAEMQGPGCIWRIWAASANNNHVRIYVDGAEEPVVDLTFSAYFSACAPFDYKSMSYTAAKGRNLYFPIPYQKSCKIVRDPNAGFFPYFHINYSTFPEGTRVPSFTGKLSAEDVKALKLLDEFFTTKLGVYPGRVNKDAKVEKKTVNVAAGSKTGLARLDGPGAISMLRVRMKFKDRADQMTALRKLALQITWDGQKNPAVWCPLGDFFGTAPGVNNYKSLVSGMTDDGFYSYWYMPFEKSAAVEFVSDDQVSREIEFEITHGPLDRPFTGLGHFHAKWHRDLAALPADRWPDWSVMQAKGAGRFCGMLLHVWSPRGGPNAAAGGGGPWWGEGDEKFFVDGEKMPSTFGTGTEDYFGYAWCDPALFQKAFHGQTMSEGNKGHQCLYRWHIADNVPFNKSFESSLEKYYANDYPTLFACTAFWYLSPDGEDSLAPVDAAQRDDYYVTPPIVIGKLKVIGYPDGSIYPVAKKVKKGEEAPDPMLGWRFANKGSKLNIALPVEKAGKYELEVRLQKDGTSAMFQVYVDDVKVGEPLDLFALANGKKEFGITAFKLGNHDLAAGEHKVTLEIVGRNPEMKSAQYILVLKGITLTPAG